MMDIGVESSHAQNAMSTALLSPGGKKIKNLVSEISKSLEVNKKRLHTHTPQKALTDEVICCDDRSFYVRYTERMYVFCRKP